MCVYRRHIIFVCMCPNIQTHTCTHAYACRYIYIDIDIHTYILTYIHTYKQTRTQRDTHLQICIPPTMVHCICFML